MKNVIYSPDAPAPIGPYSQGMQAGNTYYFSGQIAIDPATGHVVSGGIEAETRQVMKNIGALLIAAGLDFGHIVKTSIFLKDMSDFAVVNAIYGEYFSANFPARETVQVAMLPKDVMVEISVIAVK